MRQKSRAEASPDRLFGTGGLIGRLTPEDGPGPSRRTVELWRASGQGPQFIKVGRRVMYRESAIEAWLTQQTRSSTNEISPDARTAAQNRAAE